MVSTHGPPNISLRFKKKKSWTKNTLVGRPFSILKTDLFLSPPPGVMLRDVQTWAAESHVLDDLAALAPLRNFLHTWGPQRSLLPDITPSGPCLPLKPRATQLSMRTGTCREGQEILLHQTLHLLTIQLDQAVVEPRARLLPNVNDMFLRWDAGLPGTLTAVIQPHHPASLTF